MNLSLVIPGRNASATIQGCLDAVVPMLGQSGFEEIIFVDDGSTDDTAALVAGYPVRYMHSGGRGPGAARNVGWRASSGELIWFIDADCVPERDALELLVRQVGYPRVAGVGGSYGNLREDSLLACLIHEEIRVRHLSMPAEVDYLGSFNVLYWRWVLEKVGGFDEREFNASLAPGAEDADLSFRISDLGYSLRFDPNARVGHHHPIRMKSYLRSQRLHGRWALRLYFRHHKRAGRNSYSNWVDHIQPPLAAAAVLAVPTLFFPVTQPLAPLLATALIGLQLPMALRLILGTGQRRYAAFIPMGVVRAAARALGMTQAAIGLLRDRVNLLAAN